MKVVAHRETTLLDAVNQNQAGLNEVQLQKKFDLTYKCS